MYAGCIGEMISPAGCGILRPCCRMHPLWFLATILSAPAELIAWGFDAGGSSQPLHLPAQAPVSDLPLSPWDSVVPESIVVDASATSIRGMDSHAHLHAEWNPRIVVDPLSSPSQHDGHGDVFQHHVDGWWKPSRNVRNDTACHHQQSVLAKMLDSERRFVLWLRAGLFVVLAAASSRRLRVFQRRGAALRGCRRSRASWPVGRGRDGTGARP